MKFSIIIPTLNEENVIRRCIRETRSTAPDAEIIVADGKSLDKTVKIAEEEGALVCVSTKGRGSQLKSGSDLASGDVLVFLHADTQLSGNAFEEISTWFSNNQSEMGVFQLEFDVKHPILRLYEKITALNFFFIFGDRCIAIKKSFLTRIGGFPDLPLYEDLSLISKVRKFGTLHRFKNYVTTSSRRYLNHGIVRQELADIWYTAQYLLGVPVERLSIKYEQNGKTKDFTSVGIFVKLPQAGKVKTRLAEKIGDKSAADFYKLCAEIVTGEVLTLNNHVRRYIFYSDAGDVNRIRKWIGKGYYLVPQVEGDLGKRLENAAEIMLDHGSRKAIIIGSDIPDIHAGVVDRAIQLLDSNDVVIGPSQDGGYYLIGFKKLHPELFQEILWSTGKVFEQTLNAANRLNLTVGRLPVMVDIDTTADLSEWAITADRKRFKKLLEIVSEPII